MAANRLQEAISLIKSGDERTGQRLLKEVLDVDPRNATAWLWMSVLMTGEKRRFCLEKVLSIDPYHREARELLAKLTPSVPPAQSGVALPAVKSPVAQDVSLAVPYTTTSQPEVAPVISKAHIQGSSGRQVWVIPWQGTDHTFTVIYLLGDSLLSFEGVQPKNPAALSEIEPEITIRQLENKFYWLGNLINYDRVYLMDIKEVVLSGNKLHIDYVDEHGDQTSMYASIDAESSDTLLKALHERLGPHFRRIKRPMSRNQVIASTVVFFTAISCGIGFLVWLAEGEVRSVGRGTERGLLSMLFLSIGPNGFLIIGSVLLAIVIVRMLLLLAAPPEETVLARTAGTETNH